MIWIGFELMQKRRDNEFYLGATRQSCKVVYRRYRRCGANNSANKTSAQISVMLDMVR
jgi:hypothetical protein